MWRLGILPEAPAQEEDKVKESRRGAREQVQAGQKALPRGANRAGPASFSRSALVIFARQLLTWRSPARLLPNLQEPLRPGSEGTSAGAATACHRCPPWILPKAAVFGCEMISAAGSLFLTPAGKSLAIEPVSSRETVTRYIMSAQIEKIALFIDGANLYATAKSLGFDIDYKRLLREFQSRGYLVRAFYYTAVIEDQEYSSIRPL